MQAPTLNPITEEQAALLRSFVEQIPPIMQIVQECEECEVQIPGVTESLQRSLRVSQALLKLYEKHKV